MKKLLLPLLCGALVAGAMLWLGTPQANAVKQFKDQFAAKYVKPDSKDPKEKALAEAYAKAKCLTCHEGKSKKNRNVFGRALAELLDRRKDKSDKEKIQKALDTVARKKSNPDDADSPTFGDLIKEGKLPGGEPKGRLRPGSRGPGGTWSRRGQAEDENTVNQGDRRPRRMRT